MTNTLLEEAALAKKRIARFSMSVKKMATALERNVERAADILSQTGLSTSDDFGSDLLSELDSEHENSKYGINALRRPFF